MRSWAFPNLSKIFTANDADSPDPISKFSEATGVYDNIRPDVSIVPGKGGVTSAGQLYVGSELKVSLKSTDSYYPATSDTNLQSVVYLTNSSGEVVSVSEGSYNNFYL